LVKFAYDISDSDCVQKLQMKFNQFKKMPQNTLRLDAPNSGYVSKANIDTFGFLFCEIINLQIELHSTLLELCSVFEENIAISFSVSLLSS
jgi:hypothetical protein